VAGSKKGGKKYFRWEAVLEKFSFMEDSSISYAQEVGFNVYDIIKCWFFNVFVENRIGEKGGGGERGLAFLGCLLDALSSVFCALRSVIRLILSCLCLSLLTLRAFES
jgi:hypothetical protein